MQLGQKLRGLLFILALYILGCVICSYDRIVLVIYFQFFTCQFNTDVICLAVDRRTGATLRRSFRQFLPTRLIVLESFGTRRLPLWNEHSETTRWAVC